jgi:hypothetical protein
MQCGEVRTEVEVGKAEAAKTMRRGEQKGRDVMVQSLMETEGSGRFLLFVSFRCKCVSM